MADQEAYDVVAHYDPVAGEIVEPLDTLTLDTLNVREITCFKIKLDEIEDADADIDNGVTFDGDLFMSDTSTLQLATVQGVGGAEIDFLDDIAFDTGSGVKFGLGTKLDEYDELTLTGTWTGGASGSVYLTSWNNRVTISVPAFSVTYSGSGNIEFSVAIPDAWLPASYGAGKVMAAITRTATGTQFLYTVSPSVVNKKLSVFPVDPAYVPPADLYAFSGCSVTYII